MLTTSRTTTAQTTQAKFQKKKGRRNERQTGATARAKNTPKTGNKNVIVSVPSTSEKLPNNKTGFGLEVFQTSISAASAISAVALLATSLAIAYKTKQSILKRGSDRSKERFREQEEEKAMDKIMNAGDGESYRELVKVGDLSEASEAMRFRAVNDRVMGGVSDGAMLPPTAKVTQEFSRFGGIVRVENNGGFSSVRRELDGGVVDASAMRGVYVKCRASKDEDALKTFLLLAKDYECSRNFANFKSAFSVKALTGDEWETKLFPFNRFGNAERMGRPIERGPLNVMEVNEIGFMILKGDEKQVGRFGLDIKEFGFYK